MNRYIIASSLTLLVYCCTSVFNVSAAASGGNPPQRPDGQLCLAVPGGIQAMHEESGPAGLTYFADQPNQTIQSPFSVPPPFEIALYDADGLPNTTVLFTSGSNRVWAHSFKTSNNQWSETLPVTVTVDALELTLPTDHASTHVCILQSVAQTPTLTPTNTATSPATITPTATEPPMPTSTEAEPPTPTTLPTLTMTATATNTREAATATPTATNTPLSLLLSTSTPTPTSTGTPMGQAVQATPTRTAEAPTGLDLSREPSAPPSASLYLPFIAR